MLNVSTLTRKRSLVRIQSCLPYLSTTYSQFIDNFNPRLGTFEPDQEIEAAPSSRRSIRSRRAVCDPKPDGSYQMQEGIAHLDFENARVQVSVSGPSVYSVTTK